MATLLGAVCALGLGAWVVARLWRLCLAEAPDEPIVGEEHLPLRGRWLRLLMALPGIGCIAVGVSLVSFVVLTSVFMLCRLPR